MASYLVYRLAAEWSESKQHVRTIVSIQFHILQRKLLAEQKRRRREELLPSKKRIRDSHQY